MKNPDGFGYCSLPHRPDRTSLTGGWIGAISVFILRAKPIGAESPRKLGSFSTSKPNFTHEFISCVRALRCQAPKVCMRGSIATGLAARPYPPELDTAVEQPRTRSAAV